MEDEIIFEKRTIWTVLKKGFLPGALILILLAVFFIACKINAEAHHAMQEARDVRVAMRLMDLECHALGQDLYDPRRADGMAEGAAKRLRNLSMADGTVILTGWNFDTGMPSSFTYKRGAILVEYKALDGGAATDGQWDIYCTLHVLQYTTKWNE